VLPAPVPAPCLWEELPMQRKGVACAASAQTRLVTESPSQHLAAWLSRAPTPCCAGFLRRVPTRVATLDSRRAPLSSLIESSPRSAALACSENPAGEKTHLPALASAIMASIAIGVAGTLPRQLRTVAAAGPRRSQALPPSAAAGRPRQSRRTAVQASKGDGEWRRAG
jgi:hypothetical protein